MRVRFSEVFQQVEGGGYTPKVPVQIGGITMGPGVVFGQGVSFGGIDIAAMADSDIEADQADDGTVTIQGFYKK